MLRGFRRRATRHRASLAAYTAFVAAVLVAEFLCGPPANATWCFPYPERVGSLAIPGVARTIVTSGNTAYVATDGGQLVTIDITDPTAPQITGTFSLPGGAYDVAVVDTLAYVVHYGTGGAMWVIDVSTPSSPQFVDSVITPGIPSGIDIDGGYAYVADGFIGGLLVIDISSPDSVHIVGRNADWPLAEDVAVRGSYAYVASLAAGLVVYDVSNPTAPQFVTSVWSVDGAERVSLAGDVAYVGNAATPLDLVDISNPFSPSVFSRIDGTHSGPAPVVAVTASQHALRAAEVFADIDVADPSNPSIISSVSIAARAVAVDGNYAFVCTPTDLFVYDVSSPVDPPDEAPIALPGQAYGVAMQEKYAYLALGTAGLHVADLSNPVAPQLVGSVDTPGNARDVVVDGALAYIADWSTGGLQVVDISSPTAPTILGSVPMVGVAVAVSGSLAYVAEGPAGLSVVDVSTPSTPVVIGNVNTTGTSKQATGVVAAGSYVYYSDFWSGLQIVDASTPTAPVIVGTVHPSGNAADVALSGDLIYLANSGGGLSIIDVSVPASPVLLSTIKPSPGTAQHVSLSGNHAFGAWATYGLEVIDVSDPSAPLDEGILWRGDYLRDVAVQDGMMCALWESTGLTVMQPPCEVVTGVQNNVATGAPTHLLEIVPNPFNPSTSIRFELAAAAPVTLKVFSVTGSLVSTLVPQGTTMTAGWHSVRWNGTNSSGHAVASGTYFARLESRDIVASSRLTLLK